MKANAEKKGRGTRSRKRRPYFYSANFGTDSGTSTGFSSENVTVPDITIPPVIIPDVIIRGYSIPNITIPTLNLPFGESIPGFTIPGRTVPDQIIQGRTIPGRTIPGGTFARHGVNIRNVSAGSHIRFGNFVIERDTEDSISASQNGNRITVTRVKDGIETKEVYEKEQLVSVTRRKLD
jgi:hypothetical protein